MYDDGTIAFVFTKSEQGGEVFFNDSHTYIPRIPQSPSVSEPIIINTVNDGKYAIGRGVIIDGNAGMAYDISQIGEADFPDRITIGKPFEIPDIGLVTPEVESCGFKYSMSYINPDRLGGSGVVSSPFQEAAVQIEMASCHFDEVSPERMRTVYLETGEVSIKKPQSFLKKIGRSILNR